MRDRRLLRLLLTAFLFVAVLSGTAQAYPPRIIWQCRANGVTCTLQTEGDPFFRLNEIRLATYTVPGNHSGGLFHSFFSSALLIDGENTIRLEGKRIWASDDEKTWHDVRLQTSNGDHIPLFHLTSEGDTFSAQRSITLGLADIHPQLAKIIEEVYLVADAAFSDAQSSWRGLEHAKDTGRLLRQLKKKLEDLFNKPLAEVAEEDFDSLFSGDLSEYRDEFATLFRSLRDGLAEQKKVVDEMLADADGSLHRITQDTLEERVPQGDDSPLDDRLYSDLDADLPSVPSPELPEPDEDDQDTRDEEAWKKYADDVIAQLESCLNESNRVIERGAFLDIVRSWQATVGEIHNSFKLLPDALVSEAAPFVRSVERVSAYVRQFIDSEGWFRDSVVPVTIREAIATHIEPFDAQRAASLRNATNLWLLDAEATPEQQMAMRMMPVLTYLYRAVAAGYARRHVADSMTDQTTNWLLVVGQAGASFTPMGDVLDLCEVVSGREACLPGGRDLGVYERVAAGLGTVVGNRHVWSLVGSGVGGVVMMVASKLSKIDDALSALPAEVRQQMIRRFSAEALDKLSDIPGARIVELATDLGDDVLERLAKQLRGADIERLSIELSSGNLRKLAAQISGHDILELRNAYGIAVTKGFCATWKAADIRRLLLDGERVVSTGYSSFDAMKRALGYAGTGKAWHHIVEKTPNNVTRFGAEAVHNAGNVLKLPQGAGSILLIAVRN
jgi:hypothetical protein